MIADDMMTFIKSDIIVFGLGVFLFIIATLWLVFKKIIWIIVPISSCLSSVIIMIGLLGLIGWKVTVISSNFIALMLIHNGHEYSYEYTFSTIKESFPEKNISDLIILTTNKMFWPILYTVLTTVIAFLSLIFSEIKPIIDFGWMMTMGLITSFIVTFTLLLSLITFVPRENISPSDYKESKITYFSKISQKNQKTIFTVTGIVIILSLIGISRLEVENSFINYLIKKQKFTKE